MPEDESVWAADNLHAWQERMGWTIARAAEELGIHPHSLKNQLAGKRPISVTLQRLAEMLERHPKRGKSRRPVPAVAPEFRPDPMPLATTSTLADEVLLAAAKAHASALAELVAAVVGRTVERRAYDKVNALAIAAMEAVAEASPGTRRAVNPISIAANAAVQAVACLNTERAARQTAETADPPNVEGVSFSARHGKITGNITQTLLRGGNGGTSLNSIPLLLQPSGDETVEDLAELYGYQLQDSEEEDEEGDVEDEIS